MKSCSHGRAQSKSCSRRNDYPKSCSRGKDYPKSWSRGRRMSKNPIFETDYQKSHTSLHVSFSLLSLKCLNVNKIQWTILTKCILRNTVYVHVLSYNQTTVNYTNIYKNTVYSVFEPFLPTICVHILSYNKRILRLPPRVLFLVCTYSRYNPLPSPPPSPPPTSRGGGACSLPFS